MAIGFWARYVLVGQAPDGEIFNTGFSVAMSAGFASQDDADGAVGEVVNTWVDNAGPAWRSIIGVDSVYTKIKCYGYSGTSTTAYIQAEGEIADADGRGTANTNGMPLQTCLVVSLRSTTPGRSGRGRMYLPATNLNMGVNHQIGSAVANNLASSTATWLSLVRADGGIAGIPSIISRTKDAGYEIAQVVVDTRPDIQRRRANREAVDASVSAPIT